MRNVQKIFLHSSAFVKANHCDSGNFKCNVNLNDYLLPSLVINKEGIQTLPLKTFLFLDNSQRNDLATAGLVLCMIPIIIFICVVRSILLKA